MVDFSEILKKEKHNHQEREINFSTIDFSSMKKRWEELDLLTQEDPIDPMDEIPEYSEESYKPRPLKWMPKWDDWRDYFPMSEYREWQEATIEAILKGWESGKRYAIVEGPTGCHAKGTKVFMYDGTLKNVEDIQVKDVLMGPDRYPRQVINLHRGRQEMVKIIPDEGNSFVVNLDHILSLVDYTVGATVATLITVSVRQWLEFPDKLKSFYKLWRVIWMTETTSRIPTTGFKTESLPEDDYFGFEIIHLILHNGLRAETEHLYLLDDFTVCHNSGKSTWAITLGRLFENTYLATPQKMLQNQYMRDFSKYLFELKGKATYPCLRINHTLWEIEDSDKQQGVKKHSEKTKRTPIYGTDYITLADYNKLDSDHIWRKYNCATAPCNSSSKGRIMKSECKNYDICEYTRRRDYALCYAPFTLMNFSNLLLFSLLMGDEYEDHLPYSSRSLLILDECHTLESFLYEFASINVGVQQLKPLVEFMDNVEDADRITMPFTMDEFLHYTETVIIPACKNYDKAADIENKKEKEPIEDSVAFEQNDERSRINKLEKKLKALLEEKPTDHSHVLIPDLVESEDTNMQSKKKCVGVKVKPFSVAHLGPALAFHPSNSRVLLMSATILDSTTFCKSVGIPYEEAFFIRVPSTFPAENRLIVGDLSVGSMSYAQKGATLPKMLDRILEISELHSVHKGIIHTANYENMHKLKKWVRNADVVLSGRLLFQSEGTFEEKNRLINEHTFSTEPTILCGPGFIEGIDLKDDLARFNIIMKLPFMSLGDPLTKRKSEEFPEWYALQAALSLIQAMGRPVRSKTDWAITYILDLMWKWFYEKNKNRLFPKHIQDSIRWVSKKYPQLFV
jgi:ATP-dependent DNA helicase DinG